MIGGNLEYITPKFALSEVSKFLGSANKSDFSSARVRQCGARG